MYVKPQNGCGHVIYTKWGK